MKQWIHGRKGFPEIIDGYAKDNIGTWMKREYFLKPYLIVVLVQRGRDVREER